MDYAWMFEGYAFVKHVYSFNLEVTLGDVHKSSTDERIAFTIVHIFKAFFSLENHVAVYICDSMDGRQLARKRKFDLWFWRYNDGSIIKEDQLAIIEGVGIYNTLLVHKHNPNAHELVEAFRELKARDHSSK